jgi:uncharacterized protein YdeI (BOF family)
VSIAVARSLPVGTRVHVAGVVTAESGLAGDGLIAIGDSSAGIFVRLSVATDDLTVGRVVEVDGTLAAPYGQLEVRDLKRLTVGEDFGPVSCAPVGLGDVGEKTEGSVVTISGAVSSVQTDSGRLTIEVTDGTTVVRVLADPPVGLSSDDVSRGDQVVVTGIVGQHASATGRLDGYRIWPRDRKDVAVQKPGDAETPEPLPAPTETSVYYDLASAVGMRGAAVDVDATVTATAGLLDIDGPTIVVDDGTAAVGVILPSGTTAPGIGMRVRVVGKIGRWEGGPTVLATAVESEGSIAAVSPLTTAGPLNGSLEWQLVLVCGRVDDYTTAGSRWRIQISVGGNEVVVLGEPAAGVNMSKSAVGRLVVVVGIVRRSTSDSSAFQLLPRMGLDVRLGPAPAAGVGAANGSARASGSSAYAGTAGLGTGGNAVQIASLSGHVGQNVTITGLVTQVTNATATVDDGTGQVRVGGSDAAAAISVLEPGDAVEVTGLVAQDSDGLIVEADPASLVDLPAGDSAMEGADAGNAVASGRFGGASSRAAAASVLVPDAIRRASSGGSVPPAGLALAAAVGLAIFGLAGALALTRYRRLPGGPSASR